MCYSRSLRVIAVVIVLILGGGCGGGVTPTPEPPQPLDQFQLGRFTPASTISPAGYTADITQSGLDNMIEIRQSGRRVYWTRLRGTGTWEVRYNQFIPDVVFIWQRGLHPPGPAQEVQIIKIHNTAASQRLATAQAPVINEIFLSPDGHVVAITRQEGGGELELHAVDFFKAYGTNTARGKFGGYEITDCDPSSKLNPQIDMEVGNVVTQLCTSAGPKKTLHLGQR